MKKRKNEEIYEGGGKVIGKTRKQGEREKKESALASTTESRSFKAALRAPPFKDYQHLIFSTGVYELFKKIAWSAERGLINVIDNVSWLSRTVRSDGRRKIKGNVLDFKEHSFRCSRGKWSNGSRRVVL